jgi:hypothetical protein
MNENTKKPARDEGALQRLIEAFTQFSEKGTPTVKCDRCHGLIEFQRLGSEAWESRCPCGKFNDTLRGL